MKFNQGLQQAINRGAEVVHGLDHDHIDPSCRAMAPRTAANPGSRFRPFATPIMRLTWTVTTVQLCVKSIRRSLAQLATAIRL